MNNKQFAFDLLCDQMYLLRAWKSVVANRGGAGIDRVSLSDYAQHLDANLASLAARLREGRYYPLPVRTFEMRKESGGIRKLGILSIEDRVVQRAAKDILEPLFEPSFCDCSFGFRPGRSTALTVKQVLEYRAAGDQFVVDADISQCFDSIDRDLLMQLFSARIRDKRFQSLVRMWLDTGATLPKSSAQAGAQAGVYQRVTKWVGDSMDGAMTHLLGDDETAGYGYGAPIFASPISASYASSERYGAEMGSAEEAGDEWRAHRRKEAMKRVGKDGLLLALTYSARARKLVSPVGLALTGAAVLSAAAYPAVSRAVRQYLNPDETKLHGIVQGGALSPLLANLYLHELDTATVKAGFRLVRYADDFVITCKDETEARRALDFVARKLAELRLQLHPQKTRIIRFEDGLEFLGYRFNQFQNTATPISPQDTSPVVKVVRTVRQQAPVALADARAQLAPVLTRLGQRTKQQVGRRAKQISGWLGRNRAGRSHDTA